MTNNPYEAPRAAVADYQPVDASDMAFVEDPQSLPAGRGVEWFKQGWALFAQAPGLWIGIYLVFMGIMMVCAFVPIIGSIAQSLLFPIFGAGLIFGCDALRRGQPLEFAHLFVGFSKNASQLLLLGTLYMVAVIAVLIVAFVPTVGLIGGMAMFGVGEPDALMEAMGLPLLIGVLVYMVLLMPLLMAIWFAPALVMFNEMQAFDAMKASFRGCLRNIMPFLIYGLVGMVLAVAATLPLLLGWLVLAPVMITSTYCAYRDIFYRA